MSMVLLQSNDGEIIEVARDVIRLSNTLNTMLQDLRMDAPEASETLSKPLTLSAVTASTLKKVIQWCQRHKHDRPVKVVSYDKKEKCSSDISKWDAEFLKLDQRELLELIQAANYLDVCGLIDVTCKAVANMIKASESPEEIRRTFGIENDFTPQEEKQVRSENAWCQH